MKRVIVVVGPTGVGKSKLAIEVAKELNGEIINADSTQVYKGMEIATAKVSKEQLKDVKHHLISFKDWEEDYSIYHYQQDCRRVIDNIIARGKVPIIVGGSGLYIKASLYNYDLKQNLVRNDYGIFTDEKLYNLLLKYEPNTLIHKNNRRRIERKLDDYYSNKNLNESVLIYDALFIGLTTKRELLYERINKRVEDMIVDGLIKEAKDIYITNIRTKAIMTPIGYKELFLYFKGELSFEDSISLIKKRSRRYAKRQYTWFNNQFPVTWFNVNDDFLKTVAEIIKFIKK